MIDFLKLVLPSSGDYVITVGNKSKDGKPWFKNILCTTVEEVERKATVQDADANKTVFFALASYIDNVETDEDTGREKVRRTKQHAQFFRTLAFDVDPKDREAKIVYNSKREMAEAVFKACLAIGLPDPLFVSSGNGVHCYYPLTEDISKAQWIALSELLQKALENNGLILDTTKICDPSMVLRPVGTHNKKAVPFKPVRILRDAGPFEYNTLAEILMGHLNVKNINGDRRAPSGKKSAIMDAILTTEYPPSDSLIIETKCPQIAKIAASGGIVSEPLWYGALGIAAACTEPRETAIRWSEKHPTYSEAETLKKMAQWGSGGRSATTCNYFQTRNAPLCKSCAYNGRIVSPVQLGVSTTSEVVDDEHGDQFRVPKGYIIKGAGIFRKVDDELYPVSSYLMRPVRIYVDRTTQKIMCTVTIQMPHTGWETHALAMDEIASGGADWTSWLMNRGLFISSEEVAKGMRRYMVTYLQELQAEQATEATAGTFGWLDESCTSFVLGSRLIKEDTVTDIRLTDLAANFGEAYSPRGDLQKWSAATDIFGIDGMEQHAFGFLMSAGSPLMIGSGLKSILVNLYSSESGTGKSTTGAFANSIFGNPDKLKLTVEDTNNATFKSMGVYGNLPIYIDEITGIEHKRAGNLVYFVTQGREKRRMSKDGGLQESVEWESVTMSSSNSDIYEVLQEKISIDGQLMRILQLKIDKNPVFNGRGTDDFGYKISRLLAKNYGLAGSIFIQEIIRLGGPILVFEQARKELAQTFEFTFSGKERYWHAGTVLAFATGKIFHSLGLISFDYKKVIASALEYIRALRVEFASAELDCFDILGLYSAEHTSKICVHMTNLDNSRPTVLMPYPVEAVARMEITRNNKVAFISGRYFINQTHFSRWCAIRGIDNRGVYSELEAHGVKYQREKRINLMRGTDKTVPAVRVVEIDLSHSRFADIMKQNDVGVAPPDLSLVATLEVPA